jgi:hypothetical protein
MNTENGINSFDRMTDEIIVQYEPEGLGGRGNPWKRWNRNVELPCLRKEVTQEKRSAANK